MAAKESFTAIPNSIEDITRVDTTLKIFQPMNVLVYFTLFSPVIVAIIVIVLGHENFKGLIYLGFLIGAALLRKFIYSLKGYFPALNALVLSSENSFCNAVEYTPYGNSTFSSFVFAFTICYISVPMFYLTDTPNFWVFSFFVTYFFIDTFIKYYKKCIAGFGEVLINVGIGAVLAILVTVFMIAGGSAKYLLYSEGSTNGDICYKPKNQTFRCSMYKDGKLITKL